MAYAAHPPIWRAQKARAVGDVEFVGMLMYRFRSHVPSTGHQGVRVVDLRIKGSDPLICVSPPNRVTNSQNCRFCIIKFQQL